MTLVSRAIKVPRLYDDEMMNDRLFFHRGEDFSRVIASVTIHVSDSTGMYISKLLKEALNNV